MDAAWSIQQILDTVRRYWGYDSLRPMQEQAIRAGLGGRDSVVVMPTGGGKSLCYQVPAALAERTDIVISPLIALMKDQVDGLRACGYPAAALHSGMSGQEIEAAEAEAMAGRCRLLFMAPERLLSGRGMRLVQQMRIGAFAIDEAHCISHWGHDFRPEYRQLAVLKQRFPQASVHAFTATATQRVRHDIAAQLGLHQPEMLVGPFDRPNLVYRVVPRVDAYDQVLGAVKRHANEAVIVYCITRKQTEGMAEFLRLGGVKAACYHAGLEPDERRQTQEAFAREKLDVIVATVAFGMGIDRSNVRAVVHAAMPKSIEHYQQEAGRAGRDGLEAECVLFYSAADAMKWRQLMERSVGPEGPGEALAAQIELLNEASRFFGGLVCRHRGLVEYFGQRYEPKSCGACDICLGEVEDLAESTVTAQKILSCVARVGERFGAGHVAEVLIGSNTERIKRFGHDRLSTYNLMPDFDKKALMNLALQLVDQGLLDREQEHQTLKLNAASWRVLTGKQKVRLRLPQSKVKKTRFDDESWEGVDRELFEILRTLRKEIAESRGVPPYVIFSDATLRDMARVRPSGDEGLMGVRGVGRKKLEDLGSLFLRAIAEYCSQRGVAMDVDVEERTAVREGPTVRPTQSAARVRAFELFKQGCGVDEAAQKIGRARSTTLGYLAEYVEAHRPPRLDAWVSAETQRTIAAAIDEVGETYLKPIFDHLNGAVSYDEIRLVVSHRRQRSSAAVAG